MRENRIATDYVHKDGRVVVVSDGDTGGNWSVYALNLDGSEEHIDGFYIYGSGPRLALNELDCYEGGRDIVRITGAA
jgi:hypothetical protein